MHKLGHHRGILEESFFFFTLLSSVFGSQLKFLETTYAKKNYAIDDESTEGRPQQGEE